MRMSLMKLAVMLGVAASAVGSAQAETDWVYANGYAKDHPQVGVLADDFIKLIAEKTGGELKIRHVAGGALLTSENMIDGLRGGVANMGSAVVSFSPGQLPISATLAGVVDIGLGNELSLVDVSKITSRLLEEMPELSAEYEAQGLKPLWFVPSPPYAIISNDPIEKLEDFNGKKIRTFGNIIPKMVEAAGGVPLSVSFGEVYTSLQTGVLDGALTDPPAMRSGKFNEVAKNLVTLGPDKGAATAMAPVAFVINLESWNALTPDVQKAVEEASAEMTEIGAQRMSDFAESSIQALADEGVAVHHLSMDDVVEIAAKAPTVESALISSFADKEIDGKALAAKYAEIVAAYKAGN